MSDTTGNAAVPESAPEFTGERVIPELVDDDLLNEHLARYRFANRIAGGLGLSPHILDAGCGSGYGTAELTSAASVTALDISAEAIAYARLRYKNPAVCFLQASCDALPLSSAAFDMVVAFEVIEHIERWREMVTETNRVLKASGILLVSTPNRAYYAESRGTAGPNPFHCHEFDYDEFRQSLCAVFKHVRIWTQNHAEAIVFSPQKPAGARMEASGADDPATAHFYLAACSQSLIAANEVFAWLPASANLLRERERHIVKLSGELGKKDAWLRETLDAHGELQRSHEALTAELQRQNNWAAALDREISARNARIVALQNEQTARMGWISDLESQLERAVVEIERLRAEASGLKSELIERTEWAQRLDAEIARCRVAIEDGKQELSRVAATRWVRAGVKLGVGPVVRDGR